MMMSSRKSHSLHRIKTFWDKSIIIIVVAVYIAQILLLLLIIIMIIMIGNKNKQINGMKQTQLQLLSLEILLLNVKLLRLSHQISSVVWILFRLTTIIRWSQCLGRGRTVCCQTWNKPSACCLQRRRFVTLQRLSLSLSLWSFQSVISDTVASGTDCDLTQECLIRAVFDREVLGQVFGPVFTSESDLSSCIFGSVFKTLPSDSFLLVADAGNKKH